VVICSGDKVTRIWRSLYIMSSNENQRLYRSQLYHLRAMRRGNWCVCVYHVSDDSITCNVGARGPLSGLQTLVSESNTANSLLIWGWVSACVGLTDASHDVHYGDLYDSCCLQVPAGMASSEFDTERRHFMSHLNDIVMRLLLHQVMLVTGALYTPYSLDPSCTVHATRHC